MPIGTIHLPTTSLIDTSPTGRFLTKTSCQSDISLAEYFLDQCIFYFSLSCLLVKLGFLYRTYENFSVILLEFTDRSLCIYLIVWKNYPQLLLLLIRSKIEVKIGVIFFKVSISFKVYSYNIKIHLNHTKKYSRQTMKMIS